MANWFDIFVTERVPVLRTEWLGLLPLAHALTLLIAFRLKMAEDLENPAKSTRKTVDFIRAAWKIQYEARKPPYYDVDVDKDCLGRLEELMFERSERAGIAGNCQWGLDAGDHQERWNPYRGNPESWDHRDHVDSEGEIEVRHLASEMTYV